MSMGIHRQWKNALLRMIRPRHGLNYLDVAGGTGDIAFRIKNKLEGLANFDNKETRLTLLDLNPHMLSVGRDRAMNSGKGLDFNWVCGNAESLPLEDNSQDVYTIAFGLRNVTRIDNALSEAFRVLKPGGHFYCLEFSKVQVPVFDKVYDLYSRNVIPLLGEKIAKDRASYQYLIESIRKFPTQEQLKARIESAGFKHSSIRNLSLGIAAIHSGVRI
jgi:demethylmenaquinone methyltransferase/2-methoxy-6-polyprenyl-1,4-benzoquinol methylase